MYVYKLAALCVAFKPFCTTWSRIYIVQSYQFISYICMHSIAYIVQISLCVCVCIYIDATRQP